MLQKQNANLSDISAQRAEAIRVQGTVQGVGFRPTVYRLATACGLSGEVLNDGAGVLIHVVGTATAIQAFVQQLQAECPPLARIDTLVRSPLERPTAYDGFRIVDSVSSPVQTDIPADAATCADCIVDVFNPASRWYRYPFTNCTHCGPRLSLIRTIPYDRRHTSMAAFELCPACVQAYETVEDRRFHAQPIACPQCGPHAWLEQTDGRPIAAHMSASTMDDVDVACTLLQQGKIVAIKGIGGIHLACDATNETAVQTLRQRKHRFDKPFALMARDLGIIGQYCTIKPLERELLQSAVGPVVLLQKIADPPASQCGDLKIAAGVAPGLSTLGFMLPYTPLHHLLLQRMNRPIVLTSGNVSDEPQCIDNTEAREKLNSIADVFLLHNREIINRIDDSVVRVIEGQPQVLRRARGYAPTPLRLPTAFTSAPTLLAMGGELKNTFCLLERGRAILSQHLGDLENATAFMAYQETLSLYCELLQTQPQAIAIDGHPDYLSSKLGRTMAEEQSLPLIVVQHHHAHIAACMAEHNLPLGNAPVLGIALDGLGYGEDGTLWGGEFLWADYCQFQRLGRLKPVAMIGGTQAIYQPWRNTYAQLAALDWDNLQTKYGDLPCIQFLAHQPRSLLDQLLQKGINSPLASSAGRLFDAVAAAIGICTETVSYEGQAAMQMEALIQPEDLAQAVSYPFLLDTVIVNGKSLLELDAKPLWPALLADLQQAVPAGIIAAKFHLGFANALVQAVQCLNQKKSFSQIVLTGGVFQNEILARTVQQQLSALNFTVLSHHRVPPNDGGLSLGQAAVAAARLLAC
ncbi:MAG TPA: carbamoyltransferase HypF [Stenomitos sp.]